MAITTLVGGATVVDSSRSWGLLPYSVIRAELGTEWEGSGYYDDFMDIYYDCVDESISVEEALKSIAGDYPIPNDRADLWEISRSLDIVDRG